MGERAPTISIGLPVFNGEKYLARALDCLVGQEFEDFELIISDNASTDSTAEICRAYEAKDRRIRYSRNGQNIGASPNYNRVFELARGRFFKWASHDDECDASLLRRCLETLKEAPPSAVLAFSQAEIIDDDGDRRRLSPDALASESSWPFRRFARVLARVDFANPLWGLIKSEALRRTRLMGVIEADLVLLGELALIGQLVEVPGILYRQRRHSGSAIQVHRTARALLIWHDPRRARDRIICPHWERVYAEHLKGVHHVSLSPFDRLLCYGTVPVVCYWRRLLRWTGPARGRMGLSHIARCARIDGAPSEGAGVLRR